MSQKRERNRRQEKKMDNRKKLLSILLEINPDLDYETEAALVDDGLFDSLEIMSVVMEIEERFHTEIDPDDVIAENFNSLESILKLVEKNQ